MLLITGTTLEPSLTGKLPVSQKSFCTSTIIKAIFFDFSF
jgi:hypothetical protein